MWTDRVFKASGLGVLWLTLLLGCGSGSAPLPPTLPGPAGPLSAGLHVLVRIDDHLEDPAEDATQYSTLEALADVWALPWTLAWTMASGYGAFLWSMADAIQGQPLCFTTRAKQILAWAPRSFAGPNTLPDKLTDPPGCPAREKDTKP
jgi:hypothetical protein